MSLMTTTTTLVSQTILVRSSDRVRVLDLDGNVQETFALPAELRDVSARMDTSRRRKSLSLEPGDPNVSCSGWMPTALSGGRQVDLQQTVDSTRKQATFVSLAVPVPVVCAALSALMPLEPPAVFEAGSYWARLAEALADAWPPMLMVFALGVVLAWLCYRRQRQYGMPWTPAWVVFVFLFGLPGYFGYLDASPVADLSALSQLRPKCAARSPGLLPLPPRLPRTSPNGTEVFAEGIAVL